MPERKNDPEKEEPEGGPLERKRAFMRQRRAVLRPRGDSDDETKTPAAPGEAIREYRKRQKADRPKKP